MRIFRSYLIFIIGLLAIPSTGQDIQFSQFNQLTTYANPGMAGIFDGNKKISMIYRNQWSSLSSSIPYRSAGIDAVFRYKAFNQDYYSIQMQVLNDKVGLAEYSQTFGNLGASYTKKLFSLGRDESFGHFLSFGAQGGFGQNAVNWSKLWFGRQFDTKNEQIDYSADAGEQFLLTQTGRTGYFLDLNAGLFWYSFFSDRNSLYMGMATHHLNEPNISLFQESSIANSSTYVFERKWALQLGGSFSVGESYAFRPKIDMLLQGELLLLNYGTNLVFYSNFEQEFIPKIGLFFRMANGENISAETGDIKTKTSFDSYIIVVGAELGRFDFAVSYDFTISQLSNFNRSRGAVELTFSYIGPFEGPRNIKTPKFW